VSVAQLYTLITDEAVKSFDVQALPVDLVTRIVIPIIQAVQTSPLDEAINAIRARYLDLTRKPLQTPLDDAGDDDYEPEFEPMEDKEQIINKIDQLPEEDVAVADIDLGPFQLPQPQPLAYDEAEQLGKIAISRVFTMASHVGEPEKALRPEKSGLNRLAGSNFDKDAWLTILTRLATRATPELHGDVQDASSSQDEAVLVRMQQSSLGDGIRETLWKYVVEDFRHRIDVAISWLNEEWYNDRVTQLHLAQRESDSKPHLSVETQPNYEKWVLKLLDAIIPFLDANDKVLVRFLGEIPEVSQAVLDRVKAMARDPDRVSLTVKAI
jgi:symplekin